MPENSRKKKEDSHGLDGNNTLGNSRKRLLHALEARRTILQKEQGMSFAQAIAAGFDDAHIKELISFSDCFGATRLREACIQFMSLYRSRQETIICAESLSMTTCIQSKSSQRTEGGPIIVCKLHVCDNSGGSRVLKGGYGGPHNADWSCTCDKENEICTCRSVKKHCSNLSAADEDCAPQDSFSCDKNENDHTCNGWQNSPTVAAEEKCQSASEKYKETERSSVISNESPCTSHWCNLSYCCHNPLRDSQADHMVSTPVSLAPCKDVTTCQSLPESEFPSSSQSSQVTSGEPLHEVVSNPSRYDPACIIYPERFTIQVNNSIDHECLMSHYLNHDAARKKKFVHECCSSNEECVDQAQSIYDQENVSNLIVINNQIFSASHSKDLSAKKDEEMELARKCCREQRCGNDPKPFHLCVRDKVSIFERRSLDDLIPWNGCQKHENTNLQIARKNVFERRSAENNLTGEDSNNGETETVKINGRETMVNGGDCCLRKIASSERGFQCPDDLQSFSKFNDKEAGSWNPLYQEFVPSVTSLLVESPIKKLSGNSSVRATTNELSTQGQISTNCHILVPETSAQAALPQQLIALRPSEERVKKFLERYHEKREEKLRNRFSAETEKARSIAKSAPLCLDKEYANRARKLTEKSTKLSKKISQAGKAQTCKASTSKSEKSKGQANNFRTVSDLIVANSLPTFSSAKLSAPRKASNAQRTTSKQREASGLLSGSCKSGAFKRTGNPLSSSAPSIIKIESRRVGTSSMRESTRTLTIVDNRRISQVKNSSHSRSMTSTSSADKKICAVRKASIKELIPHAITTNKAQDKCSRTNAKVKVTSLLSIANEKANAGPKSFLRKGAGSSRLRVCSGVLQPKSVNYKEADTASQSSVLALGQQSLDDPLGCLSAAEQDDATRGTPSTALPTTQTCSTFNSNCTAGYELTSTRQSSQERSPSRAISTAQICSECSDKYTDGYELASKQQSAKGMKRKGCRSTPLLSEEPSPLFLSSKTQLNCGKEVYGDNQSGAACLDDKLRQTTCPLAEPFIDSFQSNVISIQCDPFEIPAAQDRVFAEAQFWAQGSSAHHFGSGLLDVMRPTANFQQAKMKGDASKITSFLQQHVSTTNQGKDLKRFLKFGWRNTHSTAGSDQASASIYSDEDEVKLSFSEPVPKILDCYGRKRHTSGKALNTRVTGLDTNHCSPLTPEHDDSKGHKTIIRLKKSFSTHEVRSKAQDRNVSKASAVKATRSFFSLAPFRRKPIEGK
ncbi:hypothetical protein L7F22_067054 [Adiantum nelumboides]|nr:hypothetical protein [Adiantum nelumboides]